MYTAIDSKGGRRDGGSIYCLYFVLLTLCGDYTLLNVFLAIACDSLDQAAALNEVSAANDPSVSQSQPTRAFSWLKAPISAFTFKTLY